MMTGKYEIQPRFGLYDHLQGNMIDVRLYVCS